MAKPSARPFMTFAPTGIRATLALGLLAMSAVPLLILLLLAGWFAFPSVREFYQLERWFPMIRQPAEATWWLIGILALTILLAVLGMAYLAVTLIHPILRVHRGVQELARQGYHLDAPTSGADELGELSETLTQLMTRVRQELSIDDTAWGRNGHGKPAASLAGLLRIGELISQGAELVSVLDRIVEEAAAMDPQAFSFLCLQPTPDVPCGARRAFRISIEQVSTTAFDAVPVLIDASHPPSPAMHAIWESLGCPCLLLRPVMVRHRMVGMLGVGLPSASAHWPADAVDVVALFVKQTAIAIENERLLRETKALAVHDELTGTYNATYLRGRLDEEIRRAMLYQRPCALALFVVDRLAEVRTRRGAAEADQVLCQVATVIRQSLSEVDRVGRMPGDELAVLLPERNKREALRIVETIQEQITRLFAGTDGKLTVLTSVAENPLDGGTADELLRVASARIVGRANGASHG